MPCKHKSEKSDWSRMPNGIIKLHPYCNKCGTLKNVSSDRGEKINYFIIGFSKIRQILKKRGYKISDVQIRLILKELSEVEGFDDTWWITYSKQKEIFISIIRKYIKVSREILESVL